MEFAYRLAFIAAFAWFCTAKNVSAETPQILPLTTISETSLAIEMQANLPRAAHLDPALKSHIQALIDTALAEMRATATQDYDEFGKEEFWRPYSLSLSWEEHFVSPRIVSLLETRYEFTGGAHGNSDHRALLWDLQTRARITLDDIFPEPVKRTQALLAIVARLRDELIRQKIERMNLDSASARTDPGLEELEADGETLGIFTLMPSDSPGKSGGLLFHFPPYMLGSYAEGSYHLPVPASVFQAYLSPHLEGLFGGNPIRFETLSNYLWPGANIILRQPLSGDRLSSPLELIGEAPDFWFENGDARVEVRDGDENLIGEGILKASAGKPASGAASGMVPFSGTITFQPPQQNSYGKITFWRGSGEDDDGNPMKIDWWVSF
ncbi:MAG: DUF3298 and DUF4163 domain-containing protein [Fimbriimonadaceae bacterium]|nr:DUF3298 and DUF4163 domain-containing protein [Alphaproteobacteria bacterium]